MLLYANQRLSAVRNALAAGYSQTRTLDDEDARMNMTPDGFIKDQSASPNYIFWYGQAGMSIEQSTGRRFIMTVESDTQFGGRCCEREIFLLSSEMLSGLRRTYRARGVEILPRWISDGLRTKYVPLPYLYCTSS